MPTVSPDALQAMLSNAPAAIAVLDAELRYLYHTQEWCEFFATESSNLVGQLHTELFHDTSDELRFRFRQALSGAAFKASAQQNILSNKDEHYIDVDIKPWTQSDGTVGGIVVIFKDVTQAQLSKLAVQQANLRFERATVAGCIGVFEYDSKDGHFYINRVGMELLDLSLMEFDVIDYPAFVSRLEPHSKDKLEELLAGRSEPAVGSRTVLNARHRDGTLVMIDVHIQSLHDKSDASGVTGTFHDVTRHELLALEAEQALLESEAVSADLHEQQDAQRRMFAVISHELRTPAAALKMLIDTDEQLEQSTQLPVFRDTVRQLLNVLDELRTVVQPQSPIKSAQRSEMPSTVTRSVVQALEPSLSDHAIKLSIKIDKKSNTLCQFNTQGLRQILTNLIRNVEVHSGAKHMWITLLSTEMQNGSKLWCKLSVADDGRGVPARYREKIFDPFYRVDEAREGSGIGLSLSQQIASTLEGTISYEDRPGGGAQFVLNMMLERVQPEGENTEIASENRPKTQSDPLDGKYVLVAEDNKTIQVVTKAMLMKAGAKVAVADDGNKALQIFTNNQLFDIVLTDIFMPVMDGYGLTKSLRDMGFEGPIIGITAATIGDESDELIKSGADAVLAKPLEISQLKDVLLMDK